MTGLQMTGLFQLVGLVTAICAEFAYMVYLYYIVSVKTSLCETRVTGLQMFNLSEQVGLLMANYAEFACMLYLKYISFKPIYL